MRQDDTNTTTNTYTGLSSNTFKKRFYGHRSSFEKQNHPNPTILSANIWDLKRERKYFEISWSVVDKARDFDPVLYTHTLYIFHEFYIENNADALEIIKLSLFFTMAMARVSGKIQIYSEVLPRFLYSLDACLI